MFRAKVKIKNENRPLKRGLLIVNGHLAAGFQPTVKTTQQINNSTPQRPQGSTLHFSLFTFHFSFFTTTLTTLTTLLHFSLFTFRFSLFTFHFSLSLSFRARAMNLFRGGIPPYVRNDKRRRPETGYDTFGKVLYHVPRGIWVRSERYYTTSRGVFNTVRK